MSDFNVVEILNTGITGFAVILLYLGYRLTSEVQSKILDKNPNDFKTLEVFKEWKELVNTQLKNTRHFMIIALVFFSGGLAKLMYETESKIIISVGPIEEKTSPIVRHQNNDVRLNENGSAELIVSNEHNIVIQNTAMANELQNLRFSVAENQSMTRHIVAKEVEKSPIAGFGL